MLTILLATCETALRAFVDADNKLDEGFVHDLEHVIERTRSELNALASAQA